MNEEVWVRVVRKKFGGYLSRNHNAGVDVKMRICYKKLLLNDHFG